MRALWLCRWCWLLPLPLPLSLSPSTLSAMLTFSPAVIIKWSEREMYCVNFYGCHVHIPIKLDDWPHNYQWTSIIIALCGQLMSFIDSFCCIGLSLPFRRFFMQTKGVWVISSNKRAQLFLELQTLSKVIPKNASFDSILRVSSCGRCQRFRIKRSSSQFNGFNLNRCLPIKWYTPDVALQFIIQMQHGIGQANTSSV